MGESEGGMREEGKEIERSLIIIRVFGNPSPRSLKDELNDRCI